jgi:histidyl-tRNA synthetase
MAYQSVKGMKDLLPVETAVWQELERRIHDVFTRFGYDEVRTPVLEQAELFVKGSGETSDIVGKEMYSLVDKGGDTLALRPEMTPAVVRAYLQHGMGAESPIGKYYYLGPMFRQERPQKGRLRQFHQFGCEVIGGGDSAVDAETILLGIAIYQAFGLSEFLVKLSSLGCPVCRPPYRETLLAALTAVRDSLSAESQRRLATNPLRVLDSKDERDKEATRAVPLMIDHLCPECTAHFAGVRRLLDASGVQYVVDGRIVRGLDYYTRTVYEFISTDLGAQDALGGGGRYDVLVEQMGGKSTPAVGFAAGVERLLIVLEQRGLLPHVVHTPDLYIVAADADSRDAVFTHALALRRLGVTVEIDLLLRSVKAQMREANRRHARHTLVIGSSELERGIAQLKNMSDGSSADVTWNVAEELAARVTAR